MNCPKKNVSSQWNIRRPWCRLQWYQENQCLKMVDGMMWIKYCRLSSIFDKNGVFLSNILGKILWAILSHQIAHAYWFFFNFIHIVDVDLYMIPNMYTSSIRHIGTITNNPNNRYFSRATSIIVPIEEYAIKQQIKLLVVWIMIQGQSVFVL